MISVVMAARNEQLHIGRALRSLHAQTQPAAEIIVIDDESDDHTGLIASDLGATVIRVQHTTLPAALNAGLRACKSRYVVRVDADDYVHEQFLATLSLFLELNPEWQACACDYLTVDEQEKHLERFSQLEHPIGCGIAFRLDRLVELGLYDEGLPMAEDTDLWRRFTARWPIHRVELPLYRYRRHGGSLTLREAEAYAANVELVNSRAVA